ncbi:hypothetical protein [Aquabacterium sp. OR-4]|uniref:hypothetical protein n=1 Tax=Aquabacterium sp. OR-4 TaxID=2978127 RepID=UPI0028C90832|nr:hypothetical protein [Aquabacterium sp. OR-4]MDT7836452.1 hypothetical protein [Aquabacterium sp. OR-4]
MALATLSIDLVAQLASLQAGMDRAGRLAEKQAADIEARYARLSAAASGVGTALAGAVSVAGLAAFLRTTIDGVDALNDLKDSTGASIENLSALEDIAARTGTSMETVGAALLRFNKVLAEAKPGSDYAQMLKAIGLNAEELRQMDLAEALHRTAKALAGFEDGGNKARFMQELLGKSVKETGAFMVDLADASELNAKLTAQQAEEAERFNKHLAAFGANMAAAARAITGTMLPALNEFFAKLQALNKAGGFWASIGKELRANLISDRLRVVTAEIESLQATMDRRGGDAYMTRKMRGLRAEFSELQREGAEVNQWLKQWASGASLPDQADSPAKRPQIPTLPETPKGKAGRAGPRTAATDIGPVIPAERLAALKALEQTDTYKLTVLRTELEELLLLSKVPDANQPAIAQAIKATIDQINALDPAAKAMTERMARMNAALAATPSTRNLEGRQLVDDLNAELARTEDPARLRQIQEAIDEVYRGLGAIPETAEPVFAQLDQFTAEFAKNTQNALGDTLRLTLKGDFDGIAALWANMVLRMATDAAAADLTRMLFPDAGKGGASALGSLASAFTGGLSSIFGGGRATGGGTQPGGMYGIVEQGPELLRVGSRHILVMGKQGGQVTPATAASSAGAGGLHIDMSGATYNTGQGVSRAEMYSATTQASQAAVAEVFKRLHKLGVVTR